MHESNQKGSQSFSGGMVAFQQSASIWDADATKSACDKSQNESIATGSSAPVLHQAVSYFPPTMTGGQNFVVPNPLLAGGAPITLSPPLVTTTSQGPMPPPPPLDFQAQITLPSNEAIFARQATMGTHSPVLVASTGQNTSAVVTNVALHDAQELRTLMQTHDAPSNKDLEQSQTMWQQSGPIAAPPAAVPVAVHVPSLQQTTAAPPPASAPAQATQGSGSSRHNGAQDDPNNADAIDQLLGPDCSMDFMDTLFADDDDHNESQEHQGPPSAPARTAALVSPSFSSIETEEPSRPSLSPLEELFASEDLTQSSKTSTSCDNAHQTNADCIPKAFFLPEADAKKKKASSSSSAAPSAAPAPVTGMTGKSASTQNNKTSSVSSCSNKPPKRKRSVPCGGGVGPKRMNAATVLDPKTQKSMAPREYFVSMLSTRGYSTKVQPSLQCGYYHKPSPLQLASFGNSVIRAAEKNDASRLSELLRCGLSRNPCNQFLEGTLARSIKRGHHEAFKAQLDAGASIHVVDDFGRTPLHYAAWAERTCFKTVEALLNIDLNMLRVADKRGMTPLDYLTSRNAQSWVDFLAEQRDRYWPDRGEDWTEAEADASPRAPAPGVGGTIPDPDDALPLEVARSVAMGGVDPATLQADDDASTSSSASSVKEAAPPEDEETTRRPIDAVDALAAEYSAAKAKASPIKSNKRKLDDVDQQGVHQTEMLHATHRQRTCTAAKA